MLNLSVREIEGIAVVEMGIGTSLVGGNSRQLRDTIQELLQRGSTRILINLANVLYVDSTAVGDLIALHTSTTNRSGALKLLNPPPRLHDLFVITRLDHVFELFFDQGEALKSFTAGGNPDCET